MITGISGSVTMHTKCVSCGHEIVNLKYKGGGGGAGPARCVKLIE